MSARPANVPVEAARDAMETAAVPAAKLVFHRTDYVVRPLVGNRCESADHRVVLHTGACCVNRSVAGHK